MNINKQKLVEWRRWLHAHAEIAFNEHETSAYIAEQLANYPEIEVLRPTPTSVVGVLKGAKAGKTIGLRADIDALPITEEADIEFKSKNDGAMHACGHDCHGAMLLGAIDALYAMKDELCGTIKFIFQHAEEVPPGGAGQIVASGVLNDVEAFYASHVFPASDMNTVEVVAGPVSANTDTFIITIQGKGCHAARPQAGIDSLLIGTEVVQSINFIMGRNISAFDNAVITIGAFNAGTAPNIVPDTATIMGTVRTFDQNVQNSIKAMIYQRTEAICAAYGATCNIDYDLGYDSIYNDEGLCELFKQVAEKYLPHTMVNTAVPMMGGEDFSAYGSIAPTLFVNVGAGKTCNNDKTEYFPNHHPKFIINEDCLPIGCALYVGFAIEAAK
jgi:amidohydrolase